MATLGEWYMMPDGTDQNEYMPNAANMANLGVAWGVYYFFVHFYANEGWAVFGAIMINGCFQIMHALVPDTTIQSPLGGGGFSYYQLIYATGGAILGLLFDLMVPPSIRMPKKKQRLYETCYNDPSLEECIDVEIPEKWFKLYGPEDDADNLLTWF